VRNLRSLKVCNLRSDELRNLRGLNYITHFKECQVRNLRSVKVLIAQVFNCAISEVLTCVI